MLTVAAGQSLSTVIELMNIMTGDLTDNTVSAKVDAANWVSVSSESSTADPGGHAQRFVIYRGIILLL